jgi:hypothetical protein
MLQASMTPDSMTQQHRAPSPSWQSSTPRKQELKQEMKGLYSAKTRQWFLGKRLALLATLHTWKADFNDTL